MTEVEWLESIDPTPMLRLLEGKVSDRKLRLFAVACCRRIWHLLIRANKQGAIEIAERYADGLMSDTELLLVHDAAEEVLFQDCREERIVPLNFTIHYATCLPMRTKDAATGSFPPDGAANNAAESPSDAEIQDGMEAAVDSRSVGIAREKAMQSAVVRDIFGNPFRPVSVDPTWLTPTAVSLAEGIYADRAFDHLPILADALQDAGCDNDDILTHCRSARPHARGCWPVDLLLGKS